MKQQTIDMYIMSNKKYFPEGNIFNLKEKLLNTDEDTFDMISSISLKNPTAILLFSIFLGGFGVDRFAMGQAGLGVLKIFTHGGCGIWSLVDCFTAMKRAREWNYKQIIAILQKPTESRVDSHKEVNKVNADVSEVKEINTHICYVCKTQLTDDMQYCPKCRAKRKYFPQ